MPRVKLKQYNSNSRKTRKISYRKNLALDMTAYDSYRKMRAATQRVEYFYTVNCTKPAKEIPYVNVKIQGNKLRMTVDTRATINVLDRTFDRMTNINLQPTNIKAYAYNTTTLVKFLEKFEAAIETKRRYAVKTFSVVQDAQSTEGCLLSSNTAQELSLLTFNVNKITEQKSKTQKI